MAKGYILVSISLVLLLLAACRSELGYVQKSVPDGDIQAGHDAIIAYGCGSCHLIEGVSNAVGYVGPPLIEYERRHYIAGNLPNTADNLIYWIQFPQTVEPGTAMPNLNVSATDARNIAAYLYSQ
jgi:cytochrome c